MAARRWLVWFMALTVLLAGSMHAAANVPSEVEITITGLDDNQNLSGTVPFTIDVGSRAAYVTVYTNYLPLRDNTSFVVGQWSTRRSRTIKVNFDTRYVPDGAHAITVATRDRDYRLLSMRAFSVSVKNFEREDFVASHIELERPRHMESLGGNSIDVRVREFGTEEVNKLSYRVTPLGFSRADDIVSDDERISMTGQKSGWYAVTVWAYNPSGQAIDKSTVTVYFEAPR